MVFQDHLAGVIEGGADSRKLHQHFGAVLTCLHHCLHLFQMTQGTGNPVDDGLLVLVDMTMNVGNGLYLFFKCGKIFYRIASNVLLNG